MPLPGNWTEADYERAREKTGLPASASHHEIAQAWTEREKATTEALERLENEGGAFAYEELTGDEVARQVRAVVSEEAIQRYVSVELPAFDLYRSLVESRLGRRLSDAEWLAGLEVLRREVLVSAPSFGTPETD